MELKNLLKKNGEFTVNIALILDGQPILGVVYAPVLDTFWYGDINNGSFKIKKNHFNLSKNGSLKEAANNLYKIMRKINKKKFKAILINKIPNKEIGLAINDRLKKASNK